MRRLTSYIILILFFIWILPLGAFIKPAQEKKACDGRRAICLCSHLVLKQLAKMEGKVAVKQARHASEKENSSSAQPDFIRSYFHNKSIRFTAFSLKTCPLIYSYQYVRLIEHIPKV